MTSLFVRERRTLGARRIVLAVVTGLLAAITVAKADPPAPSALAAQQKPVIFIPGTLGSILELKSRPGTYPWGDYFDGLFHFSEIAWPIGADDDDRFNAKRVLAGFQILGPFKVAAYGEISKFLKQQYGGAKNSYFEFPYDWRYGNLKTACKLKDWFDKADGKFPNAHLKDRALSGGVVLVGHSMGGIVSNLFAHFYAPAGTTASVDNPCPHQYKVSMIVTVGTPYFGAMDALHGFTDGPGSGLSHLEWDKARLRQIYYSIPSLYELAPNYSACCFAGAPGAGGKASEIVDPLSIETWKAQKWIPPEMTAQPGGTEFVAKALANARLIRKILREPLPETHLVVRIAGNTTGTLLTYTGDGQTHTFAESKAGDGTVAVVSADPNDQIPDAVVSRPGDSDHLGLLNSKKVRSFLTTAIASADKSLEELQHDVRDAARAAETTGVLTRDGQNPSAAEVSVDAGDQYLPVDTAHEVKLTVYGLFMDSHGVASTLPVDDIDPKAIEAKLVTNRNQPVATTVTAGPDGTYLVAFRTPPTPGSLSLTVTLPGGLNRSVVFGVLRAAR